MIYNSDQSPFSVVIVGGGLSGTLVAVELLKQASRPLHIAIVERSHGVGRGVAYSSPLPCHLLNVPVNGVSLVRSQPNHFLHWLHGQGYGEITPQSFVPRHLFGSYVQESLQKAQDQSLHGRLTIYADDAIDLGPSDPRPQVSLGSGRVLTGDRIVLALGNPAPTPVPIANPAFYQSPNYFNSGWSGGIDSVREKSALLLIGAGLTAVDWIVALHSQGYGGSIHLLSRHGLLPQTHQLPQDYGQDWLLTQLPQTSLGLLGWLRREVRHAAHQGYDWRAVLDSLRYQTQALWVNLPLEEQQRFIRHLRPYWDSHRHRIAPEIGEIVHGLQRSQQLHIHRGYLINLEDRDKAVAVTIRPRGQMTTEEFSVGAVINCSGPQFDYSKVSDPLVQSLRARGLIMPNRVRLGLQASPNGAVVSTQGIASNWLYSLGPTRRGELWETTAVAEIRDQAEALAQELLGRRVKVTV
ncbi:MAG: FAD/NAD(P)-binding protein [Nodosilinea sp.]